ncbi:hypothetical protein [Streptomyces sp. NPDC047079]|uniref:SCO2400 family protein n=1 Tax=Streptomyces sp. NPDC047079 TaxID=3154607 RepID=UPI003407511B
MTTAEAREFTSFPGTRHPGDPRGEEATRPDSDAAPPFHPSGDVDGPPTASQGRAARRRQLARWKKNKRRAAVATAVALVGGGLTMTALDRQSGDRAQAATAPDDRTMGAAGEQTAEDVRPSDPASAPPGRHRYSPSPRSPHTASPAQPSATGAPRRQGVVTAPRTATPDTRPDAAATSRPVTTSSGRQQTASAVTGGTASSGTGTAAQQPSTPPPPPPPASTPPATGGTDPGAPQANPSSPAATSPAHLCLLVVCLG